MSVLAALVLAVSNASSDLADDESSSASDDCAFTASFLKTDCVHSIIGPKEDSPDAAAVQSNASNKGEGAGEFFDEMTGDVSSQSVSEESTQESSDTKTFNITFSIPGKDFRFIFQV